MSGVSLDPDLATSSQIGGYLFARSLVIPTTAAIPMRFFSVYVRPRQQGIKVYYVALNSVVQHSADFPGMVLDDGRQHTLRVQVHRLSAASSRGGFDTAAVVLELDGVLVQRHVLAGEVADCGGSMFSDCVTYVGGRAVEGALAGPGLTAFEMNGCVENAVMWVPARALPLLPATYDMLDKSAIVGDASANRNTRFGYNDTCVMPSGSMGFPPGFGPPLTMRSFPTTGALSFGVSVAAVLPVGGYGYLFAKNGAGSLRYYSVYVARDGTMHFYYKAVGLEGTRHVAVGSFTVANNVRFAADLHANGAVLRVEVRTASGGFFSQSFALEGSVDDCSEGGSAPCSLHVGQRAGGAYPLTPFGCVSVATLYPDGAPPTMSIVP